MHLSNLHAMCAATVCSLVCAQGLSQDAGAPGARPQQPRAGVHITATELREGACYRITITGDVDAPEVKYDAGWARSSLAAFRFRAPWTGTQFVRSIRPLVDHRNLLEQGKLFRSLRTGAEGRTFGGMHPDAERLFAWGRFGESLVLDATDGIAVAADAMLELEHHYTSLDDELPEDASGVEVCVSPKVPERLVGVTLLGADSWNSAARVTGECRPRLTASLSFRPLSAYTRRRGQSVTLTRRSGGEAQRVFEWKPGATETGAPPASWLSLHAGDTLAVECTYDGAVRGASEGYYEACEVLVLHTPPGALVSRSIASLVHGLHTCMDGVSVSTSQ